MKRIPTKYPGVYYREVRRIGHVPTAGRPEEVERVFYFTFKREGKKVEERAGSQYRDKMTEAKAARIRAERIEKKRPSPKEIRQAREEKSFDTLSALFAEWCEMRTDLKSLASEKNIFKNYIALEVGNKHPDTVSPIDIDRVRFLMQKKGVKRKAGLAPQTVKNTLRLISRVVTWGAERGYCKPLSFKIKPPRVSNLKTEDLNAEQMQALMSAIEADQHPQAGNMIKLALFTGMRRGEIFKLKWQDIDFARGFMLLRDPKGGKDLSIPLNPQASELLRGIPREKRSAFVFPGRDGEQRRDIHKITRKILDAAGLPKDFRPLHGMRHTFASTLASSGRVDLYVIQKLLGHKDASTTQRYSHLRDEALRQASDLAGEILGAQAPAKKTAPKIVVIAGAKEK